MKIGIPREIKKHEYRVGLIPSYAKLYIKAGHTVLVETSAGLGSGFSDEDYIAAGASIALDAKEVFLRSEMIIKVKEPLPEEFDFFQQGQILFTYLHLAANKELTDALLAKKVVGIAYETIQLPDGSLPCLTPMSEIAGRLSVQEGAKYLEKPFGGRGVLLGGIPGVARGRVAILGGGVVGLNAAKIAIGMGADVTLLDISAKRLAYLDDIFGVKLQTLHSNRNTIANCLKQSDLVIGAVLIPGAKAPNLVTRKMLSTMKPGAVLVDVAVDQGGCFETTHPTTHTEPTFIIDGIVHYCVANMPGAVALTSTIALSNVTLNYGLSLASKGWREAVKTDLGLRRGVNVANGKIYNEPVAKSLDMEFESLDTLT